MSLAIESGPRARAPAGDIGTIRAHAEQALVEGLTPSAVAVPDELARLEGTFRGDALQKSGVVERLAES